MCASSSAAAVPSACGRTSVTSGSSLRLYRCRNPGALYEEPADLLHAFDVEAGVDVSEGELVDGLGLEAVAGLGVDDFVGLPDSFDVGDLKRTRNSC